jgi:hypothetical protein
VNSENDSNERTMMNYVRQGISYELAHALFGISEEYYREIKQKRPHPFKMSCEEAIKHGVNSKNSANDHPIRYEE